MGAMHEILPHTADVRVRIVAGDERALFEEGAAALRTVAGPEIERGPAEPLTITVDAHDLTSLLVDFLNELVWLLAVRHVVATAVDVVQLSPERLVATVTLAPAARWSRDVKAVTYHDADVRFADGSWTTTLVLDI